MCPPSTPMKGNARATARSTTAQIRRRRATGSACQRTTAGLAPHQAAIVRAIDPGLSGLLRRGQAEQPGRAEPHDDDEDREDDDVGPPHLEDLAAQRLDEPDEDPAHDGARDAADAAEHRRGEGAEPRRVADVEGGEAVIEA